MARGLARKVAVPATRLGVDEKSAGRGQNYVTVVANLEPGHPATVEYVGDGRKQEALDGYWQQLPAAHREQVQAVAMDMWEPYFNSTVAPVPAAREKIVHDPYQVGGMLNQAVDRVRKTEHRVLTEAGDDRLAGTKYVWLHGWENLPPTQQERFDQLRGQRLKTGRAWALKEMFRDFWAGEMAGVGVYSSPSASMTATPLAASTSSALVRAGTESACVSRPRNSGPSVYFCLR